MNTHKIPSLVILILFVLAFGAFATETNEVDTMYTWDLTDFYPSIEAFQQDKASFEADMEKLSAYKGKLGDSAKTLAEGLDLYYDLERRMRRLESYASRLFDRDTRVSENKGYESEVESLRTRFSKIASYMDPELVAVGKNKIDKFIKQNSDLAVYSYPISEVFRRSKHILSEKEEKILAAAGDIDLAGYNTFSIFNNADMPHRTITLHDGTELKMTFPNFDKMRRSKNEADRKAGFEAFFGQYDQFKKTLAETLHSQIKAYKFHASVRGYDSDLQAALDNNGISTEIYTSLIQAAHENLDTFHRYLKLKARALGKEKLEYTDMYLPFSEKDAITVKYEDAQNMLLESFEPLGADYVNTIKKAYAEHWIDVWPNEGKRSGAYSSGWAYDVHPFVLMNYNETYSDTLTLAHELGHAMHSFYSNSNQAFPIADYTTFMAEVASTFNENLLNDYMIKRVKNDDEKLFLLGNFLDGTIKGTFFRQIQFAEFELMIHQKVEAGEPLTDEVLNKIFLDLTRMYYGHDKGVTDVPDMIAVEWAMVPHFYYDFYVFQYSTSVAAASYLSKKVLEGDKLALDNYYTHLLKAGGSENSVELLKQAGADMTNPGTYNALMERANRYMDEVEKILDARGL